MTQEQALQILKTGANVFLTGEPGAGKTHVINEYASYLRARHIDPAITASTGIAATHLGGMTIHSWSGIGIRTYLDRYELDKIATTEYLMKRIGRAKVLIIDEVSMLSPETLETLDLVCRNIRQSDEAFGGLQIIFVGDFFQLPPVVKNQGNQNSQHMLWGEEKPRFAYEASAWQRAKSVVCYLTEQHRQDDEVFLEILSAIRKSEITDYHLANIQARHISKEQMPDIAVKLYTHNVDVDKTNDAMLATLSAKPMTYEMSTKGKAPLVAALQKGCLSPEKLVLKIGAKVMFTKNNQREGYVNGTLGVVEDFDTYMGLPIVRTHDGRKIMVDKMDWSIEENGKIRAKISQLPLRLAWAITVHKSQGMSLEEAIMDLRDVFEFGQGYVALSRVRRLSGLHLLGWNEQTFQVHPQVLLKDREFRDSSNAAEVAFANLPSQELQTMHKNFIKACAGDEIQELVGVEAGGEVSYEPITKNNYQDGLKKKKKTITKQPGYQKIREKHPKAYTAWTKEQDEELKEFFSNGITIENLAETFGRKEGAIRMRLMKLGMMEGDFTE